MSNKRGITKRGITPLPWRADKVYCGYIWSGDKMVADFPMDEDEGTYLARMRGVGRGATPHEQQANAAFIVHACNRYDEAIRLLDQWQSINLGDKAALTELSLHTQAFRLAEPKGSGE